MSSTSFQCFGVRRNVFMLLVTIFNVGLYGLYVMDIQKNRSDVDLAPLRHYKDASIEQSEHHKSSRGNPGVQTATEFSKHRYIYSKHRNNSGKTTKTNGFRQSIQSTQNSGESSFGESQTGRLKDSEVFPAQNVIKKTSATSTLSSKEQHLSSINQKSSGKNPSQNNLLLDSSYSEEVDTSGDISVSKLQIPGKRSSKTYVTSLSRNPSSDNQLSLDKRSWQKLTPTNGSQLEKGNWEKRTALRTREEGMDIRSQPKTAVLLGNMAEGKPVQKHDQIAAAASSRSKLVKNVPKVSSADVFYGRKVLSSNFSIVYNAVPKCGSRTLQVALINLRERGRKQLKNISPPKHCSTDELDGSCFYSFYTSMPPRSFVRPHYPYISLPSNYVMINMVRDPLERFISLFFFRVYGDGGIAGSNSKPRNIDDCVQSGNIVCDPRFNRNAITFLCGVEPACSNTTRWSLERAKRNVDRYLVVGYLEDIDSMMKVLEVLVPNKLRGLYGQYISQKNATTRFKTKQKEPLSPKTIEILKKKLTLHYEFYNFIRAKFDHLKETLGIR